jgi:outer membrane protein OmpA-like peptidoglycan-associated protein
MKKQMIKSSARGLLMVGALLALAACSLNKVKDDGHLATDTSKLVWPEIQKDHWQPEGSFPDLDSLRSVAPGMSKDQLYQLLGRPHFEEGLMGVHEWNYIFNFRNGTNGEYTTCQYKALFDKNMLAQEYFWKPESCQDFLKVPDAPKPQVVYMPAEPAKTQTVTKTVVERTVDLSADALFAFDKSRESDILPGGRRELAQLAEQLRGYKNLKKVEVLGYTDRLGTDAHNQPLSQARADTVASYLVQNGVSGSVVSAHGMGSASPVTAGCSQKKRSALITCLQPDRRVEVKVEAEE